MALYNVLPVRFLRFINADCGVDNGIATEAVKEREPQLARHFVHMLPKASAMLVQSFMHCIDIHTVLLAFQVFPHFW